MPFATAWMNLEDIALSKINQTQRNRYCILFHLHRESKNLKLTEAEDCQEPELGTGER